jgi:hypothetical protein
MKLINSMIAMKRLWVCFVILLLATNNAMAFAPHPYHVSRAEIEFNAQTNKFQVALCVWPEDLEKAVAKLSKQPVDLDTTEGVEDLIRDYVANQFRIVDANAVVEEAVADDDVKEKAEGTENEIVSGKFSAEQALPESFRWVGYELELKQAWLYFEIDAGEAEAWRIESQVFFELNDDQFNQVQVGEGKQLIAEACEPNSPAVQWSRQ